MCPFCLSSAAMLIAGTVSSGGVAAVVATKLTRKLRWKIHSSAQPVNVERRNIAAANVSPR